MKRNDRFFLLLTSSATWGAFVVPASTALALGSYKGIDATDFGTLLVWVTFFTFVPGAFLASVAAILLGTIAMKCERVWVLLIHSIWIGALMSLPYCIFALMGSHSGAPGVLSFLLICIGIGSTNCLVFTLVFQRLLLIPKSEAYR